MLLARIKSNKIKQYTLLTRTLKIHLKNRVDGVPDLKIMVKEQVVTYLLILT